ncbi:MAG: CobW family GTP-binding protein, partial [Steroidobacteraceae bacterium]
MPATGRIPVTVLTGFLGSGKTTLVNRILSERHGKRIAVIENEFGEVGVDHQLVIGAEEEIFETNNGCICCKVRGDLICILGQLLKRRDRFDHVLIETTGLADPGPVAQTFFIDEDLKDQFLLDAIVTVVDAVHIERHLGETKEPGEQIAFADVLLLNKTDLVSPAELARIERRIRAMNVTAKIHRTRNADAPIDAMLGVGAFDLERVLAIDSGFLEPEYPFEWAGLYCLEPGTYCVRTGDAHSDHEHEHEHENVRLGLAVIAATDADAAALESLIEPCVRLFSTEAVAVSCGGLFEPDDRLRAIDVGHDAGDLELRIAKAGHYAVFCEHVPEEFGLRIENATPALERRFASHHHHDAEIGSVGIVDPRPLDPRKLDDWLSYLLQSRGQDIFRMKGVLNVSGEERRYVFHGVHMMFDGRLERPWNGAARTSSLIFIGRKLDRGEL